MQRNTHIAPSSDYIKQIVATQRQVHNTLVHRLRGTFRRQILLGNLHPAHRADGKSYRSIRVRFHWVTSPSALRRRRKEKCDQKNNLNQVQLVLFTYRSVPLCDDAPPLGPEQSLCCYESPINSAIPRSIQLLGKIKSLPEFRIEVRTCIRPPNSLDK